MRLLRINSDGNFSLTRFLPGEIPPYAILSHTWETDNQELTFQDMVNGAGRNKAGYRKIQFCRDQAKKDDLQYFWVDSCCIDKASSAELSEAINSMFRWYQDAVKCYVYLSDLSTSDVISLVSSRLPGGSPLSRSKWFTRGWTLQELLAPSSVEFFSKEGDWLGDKGTLELHISNITSIAVKALQGTPMSHFSLDERISWATDRQTTIEEDQAYCLLGIFEVHIQLIYGEGRKNAFRRLQEVAKFTSKPKPFSTVPFAPDPGFVNRPEFLAWIHDKCAGPGARAALVGLGGVGKSQLAIRYSHDVRDASPQTFVFWVHASTQARFEEAYRHIADRLELPGRDNPNIDVLRLVYNWLCDETNGKWIMVLDNVDDIETFFSQKSAQDKLSGSPPASLAVYLPQSRNGSILITSRNKDVATKLAGGYNSIKEVRAMDESQGLQLLQNKLQDRSTEDGAVDLLRALDYIPLAITQAAAYINRRARMTISGYLDEFRRNDKKKENLLNRDAGDLRRDDSALNSVVTTWQISFERIREERPSAADLLSLMSFFNPQGIPESILRRHSRRGAKPDDEDGAESAFDEDFDTLLAYSLIVVTADTHVCEMHALVQFCTRIWLSSIGDTEQWRRKFLALMAGEFPLGEFENWVKCQQLLPHVECLFHQEPTEEESLRKWAQVLTNAAWYMLTKGKYSAARDAAIKAVTTKEQILGHDHHSTLTSVEILGLVLQHQGKYDEAEKMNRRALEAYEKALGKEHEYTLISMSRMAEVLRHQGKYEEAEKMSQRAFEGSEKVLGKEHSTTLTSLNNLALALEAQGKYKEAENMYLQALEGYEKALGKEHPNTLILANNLALVLKDQAKYEEAESIARQTLGRRDKVMGKDHPDTLNSVSILAEVLDYQGKYDEAKKMSWQALEGKEKVLGKEHPNTLLSVSNLAVVLHNLGNHDEAEKMNRRALDGREKVLGKKHPLTLTSMNNLALVLLDYGNYGEAEKMCRRALDGMVKVLGKEHPSTLTVRDNLTRCCSMYQGNNKELFQEDELASTV